MEIIHKLIQGAQHFNIKPKAIVFEQDEEAEHFGFVIEGLTRLYRKNLKGQRVIMDFAGPGAMIGGLLMAHPKIVYPISVQSITHGQFLKIPKQTYHDHWMNYPEVVARTQMANLQRMEAIQATRELHKYPLDQKLAHILMHMSREDEDKITLQISRTDMADMAGACVESVIRIFSQWEKEGITKINSQGKEVIDKPSFQQRYL